MSQLNLFLDTDGIVRVKGMMGKFDAPRDEKYPILLHKNSTLTRSLIIDYHYKLKHGGVYKVLNQLRK
jgi:hypothetical protein